MRGISNFSYFGCQNQFQDFDLIPSVGGKVIQLQAGASLNIGDSVIISGTATCNKSTANTTQAIGIVVGGQSMPDGGVYDPGSNSISFNATLISGGILAAVAGQYVYVMTQGVFWVVCDGVIANGAQIKLSPTTAGQVTLATSSLTIAAGAVGVTSSAANGAIINGDDASGDCVGKLLDVAAAVAGDIRLAYINVQ